MGTSGLPDIHTKSPRAEGVYIRQTMSAIIYTIIICVIMWFANQHNYSSMDSLCL